MVGHVLAKDETGVRFSLPAQNNKQIIYNLRVYFELGKKNRKTEAVHKMSGTSACRRVRAGVMSYN